jgi:translation initiation factor eIF-2B subunit gamma
LAEKHRFKAMEFQAIVLADHDDGSGTRLYPLLESTPKSLLPVAGRPLIAYQLALLERSGFKEAIVVTTEKAREQLHNFNEARASKDGATTIAIEIVALDEDLDTAECLRAIKHKIRKDFVVISGDLVTDVFVHHLADVHRMNDSTCSVLLRGPKEVHLKPGEKKPKNEGTIPDFIGLDEKQSRVLCLQSASDVEESLILSRAMLRAYPNITVTNRMLDSHFYIFSHWVLELLELKKDICSIKCELLPYLIEKQFSPTPVPGQPLRQV